MDILGAHEHTSLWQRTLGPRSEDPHDLQRARLRSAYEALRRNAAQLVAQINKDLPQATIHDVRHLDALWTTADLIAGPDYEFTPIEAFVFGGAVLLHDAGHALASMAGGLAELKQKPEWRDAAVAILDAADYGSITQAAIDQPPASLFDSILFAALRAVHGRNAESLASIEITNDKTGARFPILEDNELRVHYGPLIGQIAASHNWDIEDLPTQLQSRVGAISGLPSDWIIDPIKIACLLRCADAAQIDQRRAPDFLFALLKLRGLSQSHWLAQNKLTQPIRDPDDSRALIYSSTTSYDENETEAWWVAFDLVTIINKELSSCGTLLRDTHRAEFLANHVRDAEVPARLAKHIIPEGWVPVHVQVQVSDASRVAEMLGGKNLYGEAPFVPIRELIQNAADAVRARRYYETNNPAFLGKITVRIRSAKEETGAENHWLDVEDNGIGMSERILSGPLTDFGISLWRDKLVEGEFPGLRGSNFKPTGRFGIGFYSVFMIADKVSVASKRFDHGLGEGKTLLFSQGLGRRPILLNRLPETFSAELQTVVSLKLKDDVAENFLKAEISLQPFIGVEDDPTTFEKLIRQICLSLDCDVFVEKTSDPTVKVHSSRWFEEDGEEWLTELFAPQKLLNRKHRARIRETAQRLSLIFDGERVVGRAAISDQILDATDPRELAKRTFDKKLRDEIFIGGHTTHGGLSAAQPQFINGSNAFWGVIDGRPLNVARYSGPLLLQWDLTDTFQYPEQRESWLNQQIDLFSRVGAGEDQSSAFRENLARFGRIVTGYFRFRKISRGVQYHNMDDIEEVSLESLGENVERVRICLPSINVKREEFQTLTYFNKQEFRALTALMNAPDFEDLYFPISGGRSQTKVPKDLSDHATFSGILANLVLCLKQKGFLVDVSKEAPPNFHDRTVANIIKRQISAIIVISGKRIV